MINIEAYRGSEGIPALPLPPKLHPLARRCLEEGSFLRMLSSGLGSRLSVLFPHVMRENYAAFTRVFEDTGLSHRIFLAHKANKSRAFAKEMRSLGGSIDVASEGELFNALQAGFPGDRLGATGPKTESFIQMCLLHHVTISVDSEAELDSILRQSHVLGMSHPAQILLRVSGFTPESGVILSRPSRFGIDISVLPALIKNFSPHVKKIDLKGFHFHLDTIALEEKAHAIRALLPMYALARSMGFEPHVLNIGGGFKTSFLADEKSWNDYVSAFRDGVLSGQNPLSWNNYGYGLRAENGVIRGALNTYQSYADLAGPSYLAAYLNQPFDSDQGHTLAQALADNLLDIWIEPGRSMLDQCGFSTAEVLFVKKTGSGEVLVGLNAKRGDLVFHEQDQFVDPLLVSRNSGDPSVCVSLGKGAESYGVFLIGNLCLETDFISRRKIFFPRMPKQGDLIVFPNTAGYIMDFNESESILQPLARKVCIWVDTNDHLAWCLDDIYNPSAL